MFPQVLDVMFNFLGPKDFKRERTTGPQGGWDVTYKNTATNGSLRVYPGQWGLGSVEANTNFAEYVGSSVPAKVGYMFVGALIIILIMLIFFFKLSRKMGGVKALIASLRT